MATASEGRRDHRACTLKGYIGQPVTALPDVHFVIEGYDQAATEVNGKKHSLKESEVAATLATFLRPFGEIGRAAVPSEPTCQWQDRVWRSEVKAGRRPPPEAARA